MLGEKFGRLTVIATATKYHGRKKWKCRCDCGNITEAFPAQLKSGRHKSCGCYHRDVMRALKTTHGGAHNALYWVWWSMLKRCNLKSDASYKHYGARGIKVCDRWKKFENFYADMGERPADKRYTLERINNNGNYTPKNCKWASYTAQARNKRLSLTVKYRGKIIPLKTAAELSGIKYATLRGRYYADSGNLFRPVRDWGR